MDIVTIGETMVLFTPESTGLMRYAHTFSRKFGGAESNYAIGLTRLGHKAGWISRVGNDELGKALLSFVRGEGIDVSEVKVDDEAPTGIYFKELRSANEVRVEYYREGSAASRLNKSDLNEAYIAQAKFLHISGITPALSESCHETIMEAIEIAKRNDVQIIFDPNLRRKLWSEEKARAVLLHIASKADIVLPGIDEGTFMFGEEDPHVLGERFLQHGAKLCVLKVGAKGAYYFTEDEGKLVPGFQVDHVVDPVGAGDGFAAGLTSGLLEGLSIEQSVQRGNAVGAMVTMVNGDVEGLPELEEVERFIASPSEDVTR